MEFLAYFLVFYTVYIFAKLSWEAGGQTILGTILLIAFIWGLGKVFDTMIVQCIIAIGFGIYIFLFLLEILSSMVDSINRVFKNKYKDDKE